MKAPAAMKFEIKQSDDNAQWFWHTRSPNGRITSDGAEGYATASNCRRAVRRHVELIRTRHIDIQVLS